MVQLAFLQLKINDFYVAPRKSCNHELIVPYKPLTQTCMNKVAKRNIHQEELFLDVTIAHTFHAAIKA